MKFILLILFLPTVLWCGPVKLGVDRFFEQRFSVLVKKQRVGLITNHTGIDSQLRPTAELLKEKCQLVALFSPEHGIEGSARASEKISHSIDKNGLRIYSLHGETRRPTPEMLKGIDVLVYDIQEIGCRSYTYISTLFYAMEEAAKQKIPVIVLDRPNPMGGLIVDGPMLKEKWRSFLGYVNVPYCHGMTVGELARYFNEEYKVGCALRIVPMSGWQRSMTYQETGLAWVPTSPYIPEADTPFYYASTGILGALGVVSIGIGYTLPFKVVGAPWIDGEELAIKLNAQHLPGVKFIPFNYRPFYGKFEGKLCEGVKIVITDTKTYRPLSVQYMLIGLLKSLYPIQFRSKLAKFSANDASSFCKVNGNGEMLEILKSEKYVAWKLIDYDKKERNAFCVKRKKYLIYE
ncbi:MAG: hypothetical protein KR126chlam1_01501 [Chlamydiae bacterium]|nr:hypothetical protein [Chlamydiota bacterium]